MKTKFKYTDEELIEIGESILYNSEDDPKTLALEVINKQTEIIESKLIVLPYLKVSQVKLKSKQDIDAINEHATSRLLDLVFKRTLTIEDFQKLKFSFKNKKENIQLVYFDGKFIGEFMQVKEDGYFKLLFRFE